MKYGELIKDLANEAGISQRQAKIVASAMINVIKSAILNGENPVTLPGLGVIDVEYNRLGNLQPMFRFNQNFKQEVKELVPPLSKDEIL